MCTEGEGRGGMDARGLRQGPTTCRGYRLCCRDPTLHCLATSRCEDRKDHCAMREEGGGRKGMETEGIEVLWGQDTLW